MSLVRRLVAALCIVVTIVAPSAALAQEPGVTVDPDSPSGREYALPLERARRGAEPGRAGAPAADQAAPLFGAGITDRTPGAANAEAEGKPSSKRPSKRPAPPTTAAAAPEAVRVAAASPGAPSGGAGTSALVIGGAAAVLALGVAAGLFARRRSRSPRL